MELDRTTLTHLATLASLELTEDELNRLPNELTAILRFVETLNEVPTDDIPETNQVTGLHDVVRVDEPSYPFSKEEMLATMPNTDDNGQLIVHAVFTEDSPSN